MSWTSCLTIYPDDELEGLMVLEASVQDLSNSKWLADMIRERLSNHWLTSVIQAAGSWEDFPDADQLRKDLGAN